MNGIDRDCVSAKLNLLIQIYMDYDMQDLKELLNKYKTEDKEQKPDAKTELKLGASLQSVANSVIASSLMRGAK